MDKKKSAGGKSGGAEKAPDSSTSTSKLRRANVQTVQNFLLVWLDNNIDDNSADCRNTITQLRRVINSVNTFTDGDECIQFIESMENDKACMLISGSFGQQIVPRIHDMSQVDSIFIFCGNKKRHEQWAKEWPKIKGVFTEISPICEALKQATQQCEQSTVSISLVATSGDTTNKNLDQLDSSFMYTQILKEILLSIKFEEKHIKEFATYCREQFADNDSELNNIKEFEREYRNQTPIWWYTWESFLYGMLNRALRVMDVDIIIKMGFFVCDLHRHIEKLHSEQFGGHHHSNIFIVYRGQGLSKADFEQMRKTKGGLMAFNNFLSTQKNRQVSLEFARHAVKNPDLVGILFSMEIDPSISTVPFASIDRVTCYPADDEVLFSMHTVFRIHDIKPMDEKHGLFQVDLRLTNDQDMQLRILTDCLREEICRHSNGWYQLGLFLLKMGQFNNALQVYEILLEQATNAQDKGDIYNQIGLTKSDQGKYSEALSYYEKALEIRQKSLPPHHPDLASSYNSIGFVYYKMSEYSKALSCYEKAVEIRQKTLPPNHPDLASSYNEIGAVYGKMDEHSKALSYYEKALEIRQKSLPPHHPDLASSYNSIGFVYYKMGEYSKALSFYEKALEIRQKTLPPNHPDLASSYNDIGAVYGEMDEHSKALSYYEKALEIRQKSLPPHHPDLASSYNSIGFVYYKMGEYSKALSFYEKALEIRQKTLPPNHPDLASSYNDIGAVYGEMDEHSKALSYYEKALEIRQKSLPPHHPDLASSYNSIGFVYYKMGEYSKALSFYEKALEIRQKALPSNHPNLASLYNNIGLVYGEMGNYSKALSFHERAADIGQRSLPSNHPDMEMYRKNIDLIKKKL